MCSLVCWIPWMNTKLHKSKWSGIWWIKWKESTLHSRKKGAEGYLVKNIHTSVNHINKMYYIIHSIYTFHMMIQLETHLEIKFSCFCYMYFKYHLHTYTVLNSLAPGKCGNNFIIVIPNSFYELIFWAFPVKLLSGECHRTPLMISQHGFR